MIYTTRSQAELPDEFEATAWLNIDGQYGLS